MPIKNARDAVGRLCGNDGCGMTKMIAGKASETFQFNIGGDVIDFDVEDIPVATCPNCAATYKGEDSQNAILEGRKKAEADIWLSRLIGAGVSPAQVISLKMVFAKVTEGLEHPERAAEKLAVWLLKRPGGAEVPKARRKPEAALAPVRLKLIS
jgi:hypothetical protein